MPKSVSPTPAQVEVLRKAMEDPQHRMHRLRGGFWTTPTTPMTGPVLPPGRFGDGGPTPEWYAASLTVFAMERKGWIRCVNRYKDAWKDDRELTDEGLALVQAPQLRSEEPAA